MTEPDVRDERLGATLDAAVRDVDPVSDVGVVMRRRSRLPRITASVGVAAAFVALAVVAANVVGEQSRDRPGPSPGDEAPRAAAYPAGWRSVYNSSHRVAAVVPGGWSVWVDHELPFVFDADVQPILGLASSDAAGFCRQAGLLDGLGSPSVAGEVAISVIEWTGGGWGTREPPPFPPRPELVTLADALDVERVSCASGIEQEVRTLRFVDAGRRIFVHVATDVDPDAAVIADVERVVSSLWFSPRDESAPWFSPGDPGSEHRSVRYTDPIERFSVDVPEGWRLSDQNLTPWLTEPREVLSMGTWFLMDVSDAPDDGLRLLDPPVAPAAVEHLRPTDAFVSLQASAANGGGSRPASFRSGAGPGTPGDYPFTWWSFTFSDGGRGFRLFVAVGRDAAPEVADQAWEVADSLRFEGTTAGSSAP